MRSSGRRGQALSTFRVATYGAFRGFHPDRVSRMSFGGGVAGTGILLLYALADVL